MDSAGGSIINISSVASTTAPANTSVYSATKAAVDAVTRSLAKELGARKIRVNAIHRGMVETEGVHAAGIMESDFRKPLWAASARLKTLRRPLFSWRRRMPGGSREKRWSSPVACVNRGRQQLRRPKRRQRNRERLCSLDIAVHNAGGTPLAPIQVESFHRRVALMSRNVLIHSR